MWLPASKSFFDRLAIVDLTGSLIPDTKDCCALSSDPSNVEPTRGSALHRVVVPNIPGKSVRRWETCTTDVRRWYEHWTSPGLVDVPSL